MGLLSKAFVFFMLSQASAFAQYTISTFAGTGHTTLNGDNGAAAGTNLNYTADVAVDSAGNVYIAETNAGRVRKVDSSGTITTVVGGGTHSISNGIVGTTVSSNSISPGVVAVDTMSQLP
jgi:hypothetical protein